MEFRPPRKSNRMMINVTSLIDVMFLLLIFFMVSSTFKNQPSINLVLPRSASAEETPLAPAVLFLTADGQVYLNERLLAEEDVKSSLSQLRSQGDDDRIVLRADTDATHGDVVRLIDQVKESGFTRVSLSARKIPAP